MRGYMKKNLPGCRLSKNYSFKKFQPLSLRLWHWLNMAAIVGLLATVLIRKTLLSWRTNSVLIQEKLSQAGTTITPDLAKDIAVAIRNPLWDWHIYLGFSLAALLVGRLLVLFFVEKSGFEIQPIKNLLHMGQVPALEKRSALHFNLVKLSYVIFYLATAMMIVSGLLLTFKVELKLATDLAGSIKEVHELMMWFFVVFVVGHIAGVVIAENGKDKGLISDMINGGKS